MSDVTGGSLVSSSLAQSANEAFDLHDEKNAVTLLRRIHQSTLAPDDKNELRDAVFVFRNNPESQITPEFTAKFQELGISVDDTPAVPDEPVKITVTQPEVTKKTVQGFGTARPSPRFAKVSSQVIPEVPNVSHSIVPPVVEVPSVPELPTEPIVVIDPVVTTPQPAADVHIAPEVSSIPTPIPVVSPPILEPEVAPVPAPAPVVLEPTAPETSPVSSGAPERIKEIKKIVNQLVGNPVNLIDVNNDVGREYMNALLDAMKKNNGGTANDVGQAMERLETAFAAVKETVGAAGQVPQVVETEETALPVEEVPPTTPQPQVVPASPAFSPASSTEEVPSAAGFATLEKEVVQPKVEPQVSPETPVAPAVVKPVVAPAPSTPKPEPSVSGFTSVHESHVQSEEVTQPTPSHETPSVPVAEPSPAPNVPPSPGTPSLVDGMLSVAKQKQIENLMTAQKQEAAITDKQRTDAEIAAMDPLMTPEVTNGLKQLLSEWSLFKSSGIFGTGPTGIDHALYKKLAQLNMTAVVAGRYEGATPEIKRSITDYMNGWRYEEGVIQEQGELFEHYLRRVIKHILDKRNPSATA